jgi:hypothetical protein
MQIQQMHEGRECDFCTSRNKRYFINDDTVNRRNVAIITICQLIDYSTT